MKKPRRLSLFLENRLRGFMGQFMAPLYQNCPVVIYDTRGRFAGASCLSISVCLSIMKSACQAQRCGCDTAFQANQKGCKPPWDQCHFWHPGALARSRVIPVPDDFTRLFFRGLTSCMRYPQGQFRQPIERCIRPASNQTNQRLYTIQIWLFLPGHIRQVPRESRKPHRK